ncbi:MAG: hypothetical protein MRJ68_19390 [Nitrospira sp.]|nr:hypothetical protein [Nitrospira sp.]
MTQVMEGILETGKATIEQAKAVVIKSQSARQHAADLWDALRAFRKQADAQKEEVCRPLKTAWEDAKKPFDEFGKECKGHEDALSKKMGEWDREQDRLARIEQAKIQAKIDAQNAKAIQKAEEKGKDLAEVVLKAAPVVQAPPKSIETQAGTKQTRQTRKVYKPKDLKSLMASFPDLFELSMPKFNALAKTGMLDGRADVEITEEYIYAQRG